MLHTSREKTLQIRGISFKKTVPMPVAILRNPNLSPIAKLLFADLLSYAWFNAECFPGQTKLGKDLQVSVDTVKRKLDELKKHRLINWKVRGLGYTNIYYINDIPQTMQIDVESASMLDYNSARLRNKVDEEKVNKDNDNKGMDNTNVSSILVSGFIKENPPLREDHYRTSVEYAINYYFRTYQSISGVPHSFLKPIQMKRVFETMYSFGIENDFNEENWETIIDQWFSTEIETDYNINHFATGGIMQNRYWETLYYS